MHFKDRQKHSGWLAKTGFLFLICLVTSCDQAKETDLKVIVVHARGITYPDMVNYLNSKSSTGFFKQQEAQGFIRKLVTITNAVTISNIASFETGVLPSEHGIIGHAFSLKENSSLKTVNGFTQRFRQETFWEQADLKGKKVLKVGDLTLHGKYLTHTNVDCLAQGNQTSNAQVFQLVPSNTNQNASLIQYSTSEGQSQFQLQSEYADTVRVYQLRQNTESDFLYLDHDYDYNNGFLARVKKGAWFEITSDAEPEAKQAFRLKWYVTTNGLELYVRPSYANRGYPEAFVRGIDKGLGPSKGWPNIAFYTSGKINSTTLVEEINSEMDYVMDAFSFASQKSVYDLIMIDYPIMDRLGHAFLKLKDSSPEIQEHYQNAFARMDKDFALLKDYAQRNGYELIITSGHGFSPVHSSIDINKLLNSNGINTDNGKDDWEAIGVPGKVSAHIYVNDRLSPTDRASVLSRLETTLKGLHHPIEKTPVVEEIYKKERLEDIGLNHSNAGDLYVMLNPGFVFENNNSGEDVVFGIPTFMGDHGYSLKHKDSFGTLISRNQCNPCLSTDISKMVKRALKLD